MVRYYTIQNDLKDRLKAQGIEPKRISTIDKGDYRGGFAIIMGEAMEKAPTPEESARIYQVLKGLFQRVEAQGKAFHCSGQMFSKYPDYREYYALQDANGGTVKLGPYPMISEDRALIEKSLRFIKESPPTGHFYRITPMISYYDMDAQAWTEPRPRPAPGTKGASA